MMDLLLKILEELFKSDIGLFPSDIVSEEILREWYYQVFRSFHRMSDTCAVEMNVGSTNRYIVNLWQLVEGAQGRWAVMPLHLHYPHIELILKPFIHYTWLV
jgi:hypothetical protein